MKRLQWVNLMHGASHALVVLSITCFAVDAFIIGHPILALGLIIDAGTVGLGLVTWHLTR